MIINYHRIFRKNLKKRILNDLSLTKRYEQRVRLFVKNQKSSLLRDHPLKGKLVGFRAFSITGDILFYDIGSHTQVYE